MTDSDKKSATELKELKAIAISVVFLILGFLVVWLAKKLVNIEGDAIYVTLIFIPVLVYVIISGRLTEFKGPGGLEARFTEAAAQSVRPSSETIEPSMEDLQIVAKEGIRALQNKKGEIDESKPIVMYMTIGNGIGYYDWNAVSKYMNFLVQYSNFKFVVFLDKNERFVAYMQSRAFKSLITLEELGFEFINSINDGRLNDLFRYPGVVKETITTKSTNIEALQKMTKENLEALVVIDDDRKLKGVIEREQVISKIMLTLVK